MCNEFKNRAFILLADLFLEQVVQNNFHEEHSILKAEIKKIYSKMLVARMHRVVTEHLTPEQIQALAQCDFGNQPEYAGTLSQLQKISTTLPELLSREINHFLIENLS